MASRDDEDARGFLSRWSERKRAAEEADAEAAAPLAEPVGLGDSPAERSGEGGPHEIDATQLPEIDSLESGSDFTVFLRQGVPETLKRRALRKLWALDPVFGHLDGLNDYDLDYTNAATVVQGLRTVYQVGKGMVLPEETAAEAGGGETAPTGEEATAAAPTRLADEDPADPGPERRTEDQKLEPVAAEPGAGAADQARPTPREAAEAPAANTATRRAIPSRPQLRPARLRRWGDPDD